MNYKSLTADNRRPWLISANKRPVGFSRMNAFEKNEEGEPFIYNKWCGRLIHRRDKNSTDRYGKYIVGKMR